MKQRVNIQYSIDMDNLNFEVKRLTREVEANLSNIDSDFPDEDKILDLTTLSTIEGIRSDLANVDFMLNDISKIINAYISYRTSPEPQAPTQSAATMAGHPAAEASDISEKIEHLKKLHESIKSPNDRVSRT